MSKQPKPPGFRIRRAHQIVTALLEDRLQGLLTQTQLVALVSLEHRPGADQVGLAALMGHDRSTVALVVRTLEQAGYIERQASCEDRRRKVLAITPAGAAVLNRCLVLAEELQDEVWGIFEKHEAREFDRLLTKFVDAFNDKIRTPAVLDGPNFRTWFDET